MEHIVTTDRLIEILQNQPKGTKILIEDSDGSQSQFMTESHVVTSWERDTNDGEYLEHVMMFTAHKE